MGRELRALDTWRMLSWEPRGRNVSWKHKSLRRSDFKVYILPGKIDIPSPSTPLKIITQNKRFNVWALCRCYINAIGSFLKAAMFFKEDSGNCY